MLTCAATCDIIVNCIIIACRVLWIRQKRIFIRGYAPVFAGLCDISENKGRFAIDFTEWSDCFYGKTTEAWQKYQNELFQDLRGSGNAESD